jgi:hypothetical protein
MHTAIVITGVVSTDTEHIPLVYLAFHTNSSTVFSPHLTRTYDILQYLFVWPYFKHLLHCYWLFLYVPGDLTFIILFYTALML